MGTQAHQLCVHMHTAGCDAYGKHALEKATLTLSRQLLGSAKQREYEPHCPITEQATPAQNTGWGHGKTKRKFPTHAVQTHASTNTRSAQAADDPENIRVLIWCPHIPAYSNRSVFEMWGR